jgi:Family of unknown function (DUF6152)
MKRLFVPTFLVIAALISTPVYAHHSAAGIDRTKSVTVEGTVKAFKWGNPHSWLEVEVANTKGSTDVWNFEMNPPAYLVRSGWKSTSVKAGDKVKVTGRPFMNGDPGGIFVSLTLADGQVLGAGAQPSQLTQQPAQPAQPTPR